MKRAWSDGTAIELSPLELTEKLAAIVPPPRMNQIIYAGVLAGNAAWRAEVSPKVPSSSEERKAERLALKQVKGAHAARMAASSSGRRRGQGRARSSGSEPRRIVGLDESCRRVMPSTYSASPFGRFTDPYNFLRTFLVTQMGTLPPRPWDLISGRRAFDWVSLDFC